jgi:hypothetical protein
MFHRRSTSELMEEYQNKRAQEKKRSTKEKIHMKINIQRTLKNIKVRMTVKSFINW